MEFKIKKEGWGGGGTRTIKFTKDTILKAVQIKPSGKNLNVSSPPGLSSSTSLSNLNIDFDFVWIKNNIFLRTDRKLLHSL